MLNKTVRNTLFIMCSVAVLTLLIYLIAAAAKGEIKYSEELSEIKLHQCYGAAGCIKLMEKNNIPVDKDYRKSARAASVSLTDGVNIRSVGSSELAMLICIDDTFDLGRKAALFDELDRRYDAASGLFDEYAGDSYSGMDEDTVLTMKIASTDAVHIKLNSFGLKDEKHDLKKLLADVFNNNMDKYDHNDIYSKNWTVSSELENIFYYYLINDDLDMLDHELIWKRLSSDYIRNLFETNENTESFQEKSIANISGILTDTKAKQLGADISLKYETQEYFNILDSEEDFLFDLSAEDAEYFEYTLFVDLSQPKDLDLSQNKFFVKNVQKWLIQCSEKNPA